MLDLLAADLPHWPAHSASVHTGKHNTHTHHALVRAHTHTHTGSICNYTQYTDTGIRTEDGIRIGRGRFAVKHHRRANF